MKKTFFLWVIVIGFAVTGKAQKASLSEKQEMKSQVMNILNKTVFFDYDSGLEKNKYSEVYYFQLDNKGFILSFTSSREFMSHAGGAEMSAFVFEKSGNEWKMAQKYLKFGSSGNGWGNPPEQDDLHVKQVNDGVLIAEQNSFSGQGYYTESLSLYYLNNSIVKKVDGEIIISESNGGAVGEDDYQRIIEYEGSFSFTENTVNGLPVIQVYKSGVYKGKKIAETEYYAYNGKEYELAE